MQDHRLSDRYPEVNAHLHTPYSFSAFQHIDQVLEMAAKEGVAVVGINDFFTTEGYESWAKACEKYKLFPLFNIEFIALNQEDQLAGFKVNDPGNPGRTYLSGKALSYPLRLAEPYASQLKNVYQAANAHVNSMCERLNQLLQVQQAPFRLNFKRIRQEMSLGSIRERHLAKALRLAVEEHISESERMAFYTHLFKQNVQLDLHASASLENEIRNRLLKAGGAAFVPESAAIFMSVERVITLILAAGGIPTYPFLADDVKGDFTDFEAPLSFTIERLKAMGIFSVEFISTRNSIMILEQYAQQLWKEGFLVTFGSEHNTPAMEPIRLRSREQAELSPVLKAINYESACVMAAHQEFIRNGKQGYLMADGNPRIAERELFIDKGNDLIRKALQ